MVADLRILYQRKMERIKLTIAEFEEKYYLHDSTLEKIDYDAENKTLRLEIDFCFWLQDWYNAEELPNGYIAVTFENVSFYEYEDYDPSKLFSDYTPEIWGTVIENDMLIMQTFEFVRYEPGEDLYPVMRIKAENVTVEEISRYNP